MFDDLAKALVIVTGGGSGIGRSICEQLAEAGARVIITDINIDNAKETKNSLKDPSHHHAVKVDVSSSASVKELENYIDQLGECPLGVVHAAGIGTEQGKTGAAPGQTGITKVVEEQRKSCLEATEDAWNRIINVNLKGTFLIDLAVARLMKKYKVKTGSIVNIASVARNGLAPHLEYTASKAGVVGLTKSLAQELGADNIRVNAVCPGAIETPQLYGNITEKIGNGMKNTNPLRRLGKPEDVASVCLFLLSNASGYVTGQTLNVSGGVSSQPVIYYY